MSRVVAILLLFTALSHVGSSVIADDGVKDQSIAKISWFLNEYCLECHREGKASGGLSLQTLKPDTMERDLSLWEEVVLRLESESMPPESSKNQPNPLLRKETVEVLRELVSVARERIEERQPFVLRRLNRREYANSIQDLLGIEWDPSSGLLIDDALYGFDNVAEGLQLSSILVENYLETGRAALERALRSDTAPEVRRWSYHLGHPSDFPRDSLTSVFTMGMPIYRSATNQFTSVGPHFFQRCFHTHQIVSCTKAGIGWLYG